MSTRTSFLFTMIFTVVAACERPSERSAQDREVVARVLHGTLAYPGSAVVNFGAGEDAAELVLTTPASPADVVRWYREVLQAQKWNLRSEAHDREGTVTVYAERSGRPLWIRVSPAGSGTRYVLIGAEVRGDSLQ